MEPASPARRPTMTRFPWPREDATLGVAVGILLTLITCGIYGLFWQYKQIVTLNAWLGRQEFSFVLWLLLSLLTCGIFALYYEYKMSVAINDIQRTWGIRVNGDLPVLCVLLSLLATPIVSLALQQNAINEFYDHHGDL
jgi:hypothetical protein